MTGFLGALIRRERLRQSVSQEGLCRGICAVSYLSKIEQGKAEAGEDILLPLLERHGLTQLEADILLFLANNPAYDTARDIVEKRRLAKSHVSAGIESLASRGLLERRLLPGNRKTIHLRPAEEAAPIVEQGRAIQRAYGGLLFRGFTEAEREQLFRLLDRVSENADAALAAEEGRA